MAWEVAEDGKEKDESKNILYRIPFWAQIGDALSGQVMEKSESESEELRSSQQLPKEASDKTDSNQRESAMLLACVWNRPKKSPRQPSTLDDDDISKAAAEAHAPETKETASHRRIFVGDPLALTEDEEMEQRKTREAIVRNFCKHLDNITAENGEKLVKATGGLGETMGRIGRTLLDVWDLNDLRDDTMQMKDHYEPGIKEAAGNAVASAGEHTQMLVVSAGTHTNRLLQHAQELSKSASSSDDVSEVISQSASAPTSTGTPRLLPPAAIVLGQGCTVVF
jgi:hypothetical protein